MDIYSHQDRPQHTVVAFIYIHIYQKEIFLMTIDDRLEVSCNISNEICNHPLASSFFVFRNQNLKCYKYSTKRLQSPFASFVCLDMETSYGSDSPFVISIQFCWTEQSSRHHLATWPVFRDDEDEDYHENHDYHDNQDYHDNHDDNRQSRQSWWWWWPTSVGQFGEVKVKPLSVPASSGSAWGLELFVSLRKSGNKCIHYYEVWSCSFLFAKV